MRLRSLLVFCAFGIGAEATGEQVIGTDLRFVVPEAGAEDLWPCFSPDGKKILFCRSVDGGKSCHLFLAPVEGGEAQRLDQGRLISETRPNWSRRNGIIVFVGTTTDDRQYIYTIKEGEAEIHRIDGGSLPADLTYPSWYPDGIHLAVLDYTAQTLFRVESSGKSATPMTRRDQVLAGMPNVAPDGNLIAFAGQKNLGQSYDQSQNSIWVLDQNGEVRPLETPANQGRAPSWSPDAKRLAFESNRGGQGYAIFIINRDGSDLTQITLNVLRANHPMWSPDGKKLVFDVHSADRRFPETGIAVITVPSH
jgi:Tol biopolymer transport system component